MADEKIYTTKEAGPLLANEGFDLDLSDLVPPIKVVDHVNIKSVSFVYPGKMGLLYSMSEADDIHVTLLDEDEPDASDVTKP